MPTEREAREQELLAQITEAEAEEDAAHRAAIDSHSAVRAARAVFDQAVAEAEATLNVTLAEDSRRQAIMMQKRATVAQLKRALQDVRADLQLEQARREHGEV
jgi:hypothetical protein